MVKLRRDGDVVRASRASVEVKGAHTVVLGGAHIRSVDGVGVDLTPAGRISGGAGAVGVEAFHVWQAVNGHTVRGDGDLVRIHTVLRTAVAPDIDVIRGGRGQVVQSVRIGIGLDNSACRAARSESGGAVLDLPSSGRANL